MPVDFLLLRVSFKSNIVWDPFYSYAASSSVVGDEYGVSFMF